MSLFTVIKINDLERVKTLLNNTNINTPNEYGMTPLMYASKYGKYNIVNFLLENNADLNIENKYQYNHTALEEACTSDNNLLIVTLLLNNGAYVNHRTSNNMTPLMIATNLGQSKIVNELINRGANVNIVANNDSSPISMAINKGYVNIVNLLVNAPNFDINLIHINRNTPLMLATIKNNLEIVKILVEKGASINFTNDMNQTPLLYAKISNTSNQYDELIKYLEEKNAIQPTDETINNYYQTKLEKYTQKLNQLNK
jgi:ankyrin repeat protein